MKYLVKVTADGKAETYTTEADSAASAMFSAYEKYGLCGVTVSPAEGGVTALKRNDGSLSGVFLREDVVEQVAVPVVLADRNAVLEEAAKLVESTPLERDAETVDLDPEDVLFFKITAKFAERLRALKSADPACPVDTAIANLDALLAERRAAQLVPRGYKLVPIDPTPEILEALRTGSRKDWPSNELCAVRYAALLAAIPAATEPIAATDFSTMDHAQLAALGREAAEPVEPDDEAVQQANAGIKLLLTALTRCRFEDSISRRSKIANDAVEALAKVFEPANRKTS